MDKTPAVYILASKPFGTLYIGVTSDLLARAWQHRNGQGSKFTSKYDVKMLVYFEIHEDMEQAILREKQLKAWKREWKVELIEKDNPEWKDRWPELLQ
ncbi:GIY-YIG nuclease family protein [Calycomorphotria hydatis]|nr:GIY-YIG nuclease family protein [Calycomorphotria hydatis]